MEITTTTQCSWFVRVLILVYVWTLMADAQLANQGAGILTSDGVVSTEGTIIVTRVGCRETFVCLGNGTNVEWKLFGSRQTLALGTNRMINTTTIFVDAEGIISFKSQLIFDPVLKNDFASYTCNIGVIATVDLRVQPDLGAVMISSSVSDLSNSTIGDDMFILCYVDTCIPDVTLSLMKGQDVIKMNVFQDTSLRTSQFNFNVTNDLVGEYTCRLMGSYMGTSFDVSDALNITGIPRLPPTTVAVPAQVTQSSGSISHVILTTVLFLVSFLAALLV